MRRITTLWLAVGLIAGANAVSAASLDSILASEEQPIARSVNIVEIAASAQDLTPEQQRQRQLQAQQIRKMNQQKESLRQRNLQIRANQKKAQEAEAARQYKLMDAKKRKMARERAKRKALTLRRERIAKENAKKK